VPAGQQWIVNALNFSVVTSATVATRTAYITAKGASGHIMMEAFAAYGSAAGQTCVLTFGTGETLQTGTTDFVFLTSQMGTMYLEPGATITINFINLQAGDQISGITLMVQSQPS
jgi:hypothetical protein